MPWPDADAVPNCASPVHCTATATQAPSSTATATPAPSTADEDNAILTVQLAQFYRQWWPREVIFWLLCAATAFLLRLLLRWNDDWHARLRFVSVAHDDPRATHVVAMSMDRYHTLARVLALDPTRQCWVPATGQVQQLHAGWARAFEWRSTLFWFNETTRTWTRIQFDVAKPYHELHRRAAVAAWDESHASPAEQAEQRDRRTAMYGANVLDVKPKPFVALLIEEALRPFFAFQVFSMIVWFTQDYVVYAYTVLGLSVLAILNTAYTTWVNINDLQRLAKSDVPVQRLVCSNTPHDSDDPSDTRSGWSPVPTLRPIQTMSSMLVPGDLIQVSADLVLPCDVVLLTGSCVVNEAMLTGESAPVLKAPLPAQMETIFNPTSDRDAKYLLFSGTRVVQARAAAQAPFPVVPLSIDGAKGSSSAATARVPSSLWQLSKTAAATALGHHLRTLHLNTREKDIIAAEKAYRAAWHGPALPVVGMVIQTSFSTAKGQLIRAILYPKPSKFDFQRQTYNFIFVLLLACLAGCVATIGYSAQLGVPALDVFKSCLNLITVTIPPALPLALSIGLSAALLRIQNMGVFCTSPPRISAAGRVNCLCFDKTGTLTEEGLALEGIQSVDLASDGTKKLVVGAVEKNLSHFYHSTMAQPNTLAVYDVDALEELGTTELANSLRLGMVHVLAACHGLSVLQHLPPSQIVQADAQLGAPRLVPFTKTPSEPTPAGIEPLLDAGPLAEPLVVPLGSRQVQYTMEQMKAHFVGDPLEVQMFLNTGWSFMCRSDGSESATSETGTIALPPPDEILASQVWSLPALPRHVDTILFPPASFVTQDSHALAILRRFDFDSSLRRMSVVVQLMPVNELRTSFTPSADSTRFALLCKGAPESIRDICQPATIPADFDVTLRKLTIDGFRVLACAVRPWLASPDESDRPDSEALLQQLMTGSRASLEQKLLFTGFLVMENKLKAETSEMLETYTRAGLRCVMVTGDNPLTAIAVAKRCGPFFMRPSRRTCLLDLEGPVDKVDHEHHRKPRLVLRDVVNPEVEIDFNNLMSGRIPGFQVGANPYFATDEIGEPLTQATAWKALSPDVDIAVTGPAFVALQSLHDDTLADRQQHDGQHRKQRAARSWFSDTTKSYQTLSEEGQLMGPLIRTETGEVVPLTPLQIVLARANIFARMSPQNKQQLMTSLQDMSYVVCMTGDGANDSGALKAADIGISIQASAIAEVSCPEENDKSWWRHALEWLGVHSLIDKKKDSATDSVAAAPSIAAPFSTQIAHIGAVHIVLTEGRCCLVSTFAMFKFMFCYGLIQFTSVIILYKLVLELADYQYLWADLGLVFPLVLTMPLITAQKQLCRGRPESDLLSPSVFRSVLGLSVLVVGFQVLASEMLHWQDFYVPPVYCGDDCSANTDPKFNDDTTTSYLFSSFQYISVGVALSQSFGLFRQPLYHHFILCSVMIGQLVCMSCFLLTPTPGIENAFSLQTLPEVFRWKLWILCMVNSLAFISFERFFVPHKSPDEEPFDVDAVIRELPPPSTACPAKPAKRPRPDYQPTLLPKMRWRKPAYVLVDEVTSPVWSVLST